MIAVRLEDDRDDGQNHEYDDQPFGDFPAESGDPFCPKYPRNDREYEEEDRELEEPSSKQ